VAQLLRGEELKEIPDLPFAVLKKFLEKVSDQNLQTPEKFLCSIPAPAAEFLLEEHFAEVWNTVLKNLPPRAGAAVQAFHGWFDGLKTLRFLHFLS
jgi:hypothetical protein